MSEDAWENDFRSLPRRLFDVTLEDERDSVEVPKILAENGDNHVFENLDERSDSVKEQQSIGRDECTEEALQGYAVPSLEDMLGVLRACVAGEALALHEAEEARSVAERELEQLRLEIRALEVSRNRLLDEVEQLVVRRQELQATPSRTLKPFSEHAVVAWVSKDPATAATLLLARSLLSRALESSELDGEAYTDAVAVAAEAVQHHAPRAEPGTNLSTSVSPPASPPLSPTTAAPSSPERVLAPSPVAAVLGHAGARAAIDGDCAGVDDLHRAEVKVHGDSDAASATAGIGGAGVDDFVAQALEADDAAIVVEADAEVDEVDTEVDEMAMDVDEDIGLHSDDEVYIAQPSSHSPQAAAEVDTHVIDAHAADALPVAAAPTPPLPARALAAPVAATPPLRPNEHASSSPASFSSPVAPGTGVAAVDTLTTPRRPRVEAAAHAPSPAVAALEHDLMQLQRRWNVERHQLLHLGAAQTQRLSKRPELAGAAWAEEVEEEVEEVDARAGWLSSRLDDSAVAEVLEADAADGGAAGGEGVRERIAHVSDGVSRLPGGRSPHTRTPALVSASVFSVSSVSSPPPLPTPASAAPASSPPSREAELDALHARVLQGDASAVAALIALTTRTPTHPLTATAPSKVGILGSSPLPLTRSTTSTSAPATVASVATSPTHPDASDGVVSASTYPSTHASASASASVTSSPSAPTPATPTTPTPSQPQSQSAARSAAIAAPAVPAHTFASTTALHRSLSRLRTRLAARRAACVCPSTSTSTPASPVSTSTSASASTSIATPIRLPAAPVSTASPTHRAHLAASFSSPTSLAAFTPSRTLPRDLPSPTPPHAAAASRSAPPTARPLPQPASARPASAAPLHTAPATPGLRAYPQTARLPHSAHTARASASRLSSPSSALHPPARVTLVHAAHSSAGTTTVPSRAAVPALASAAALAPRSGASPASPAPVPVPVSKPVSMPGSALASPAPSALSALSALSAASAASTNTPRHPALAHHYSSPFAPPYASSYASPYAPTAPDAAWRTAVAMAHSTSPPPHSRPASASASASASAFGPTHTAPAYTHLHSTPPYASVLGPSPSQLQHPHAHMSPPETPTHTPPPSTDASPLPVSYRARKEALLRETARAFGGASLAVVAERGRDVEWSKGRL